MLELVCDKCGRRGRYRLARLVAAHGADKKLPDLRVELAACTRAGDVRDPCGAVFRDPGRR
jgi:hypothetical protein